MGRENIVDCLQKNYLIIKEGRGKWQDKRVIYLIARAFTVNNRHYVDEEYRQMEELIKQETGFFTALGQPIKGILIGLLLSNGKKMTSVHTLIADYERLREAGFKLSGFSYFAAYLLQYTETAEKEFIIKKAKDIYKELKAHHYFLTGAEDGALAISLAQQEQLEDLSAEVIGSLVEKYYQQLNEIGFYKSNQLQFAAATATMLTGQFSEELIERTIEIVERIKQKNIRLKAEYYNNIITLAFLDLLDPIDLDGVTDYLTLLEKKTNLRFYQEFRKSLAFGLLINEKMNSLSMESINISALTVTMTIMEEMSTIAATAAVTASISSSNS